MMYVFLLHAKVNFPSDQLILNSPSLRASVLTRFVVRKIFIHFKAIKACHNLVQAINATSKSCGTHAIKFYQPHSSFLNGARSALSSLIPE